MSNLCPCGEPAPEAFLGKRCAARLEGALGDLPALIADLDITLARQAVTGAHSPDGGKPPKKDAQPLPFHKNAGEAATYLHQTLVWAIKHLTEARGLTVLPADNTLAMARWLHKHHDSIRLDPAGPDIAKAIHAVTAYIMEVVDLSKTRSRFKVGMCPEPVEVVHTPDGRIVITAYCPGEVWVHLPAEDQGEAPSMRCRCCHRIWATIEWNSAGKRIQKRGAA